MEKKSIKRLRTIALWAAGLVLIFVLAYPWPVEKQLSGVLISLDEPGFSEPVTVEFSGKYYVNLFTADQYWGYVRISNDPMTQNYPITYDIDIGRNYEEPLTYSFTHVEDSWEYKQSEDDYGVYESGRLLSKRFMRSLYIEIPEHEEGALPSYQGLINRKGYVIVTGASDYESALTLLEQNYGPILDTPEEDKNAHRPNVPKRSHEIHILN